MLTRYKSYTIRLKGEICWIISSIVKYEGLHDQISETIIRLVLFLMEQYSVINDENFKSDMREALKIIVSK